jgi:hypothetical protein
MKKVSIVKYQLKGVPLSKRNALHRDLYGYKDYSNKGEYSYDRKGILDKIKHTKISNSVIMLETKDLESIEKVLDKHKISRDVFHLFKKP